MGLGSITHAISHAVSQVSAAAQQTGVFKEPLRVRSAADDAASKVPGYTTTKDYTNAALPILGSVVPGAQIPLATSILARSSFGGAAAIDQGTSTAGQFLNKVTFGGTPLAFVSSGFRDSALDTAAAFFGSMIPQGALDLVSAATQFIAGPSSSDGGGGGGGGGGFGSPLRSSSSLPLLLFCAAGAAFIGLIYLITRRR